MRALMLSLLMATGLVAHGSQDPTPTPPMVLTPPITQIILIRHSEYAMDGRSAKLTEAGVSRAKRWALVLALYEPTALFTTEGPVSQATLNATAKNLKLAPKAFVAKAPKDLAKEILDNQVGKSVVVCWPAKQLKPLALALGVPEPLAEWPDAVYDQLWVIRLDAKGAGTIDSGPQSAPPDPAGPTGNAAVWGFVR